MNDQDGRKAAQPRMPAMRGKRPSELDSFWDSNCGKNGGAVSVVAYLHPNARALHLEGDAVKHALIIEDIALIAEMLRDYLEECGYKTVDLAKTQGEAIQLAERRCLDLITADDRLEHGSGIEAIRHICHDRAIPVIFIVADPTNLERALPNALLLQKPFSE